MIPLKRTLLIAASALGLLGLGCASTPALRANAAASQPFEIPKTEAYDLARRVAWTAGFDRFSKVKQLDFHFVVDRDGAEVFRAKHNWDLEKRRARIQWTDKDGHVFDALLMLDGRTATGTKDDVPLIGDDQRALSESAYSRWVNDTYWFLLPIKLFDRGSHLEMAEPRMIDGKEHKVLRLSYDAGVGLTSGDQYWLFIDPDAFRIVRWEMKLEGQTGPPRGVKWQSYRPVGPLLLAHDHPNDDGTVNVRIDESAAHRDIQPDAFELPKVIP